MGEKTQSCSIKSAYNFTNRYSRWTLQRRRMMYAWDVFYCTLGRKIWSLLTSDWRPARSWRNDMRPVCHQRSSGKGSSKAYLWTNSIMSWWYFGARSVTRDSGKHKCSTGCAISRSGNFLRSAIVTRHTLLTKQAPDPLTCDSSAGSSNPARQVRI